jgi:DNA processing protein
MHNDIHLIALCSIPDIGPVTVRRLVSVFGSAEAVFKSGVKELTGVEGVGKKRAEAIKNFSGFSGIERNLKKLKNQGVKVIALDSDRYPEMLRNIQDPPLVIYMKGDMTPEDKYAIAIVGSRKPTPYGISVTETMASELASMGFTIVSGLARGIDTAAHKGGVRCGGRSIAVLGSGIDVPYPPENKGLMERISKAGCVLSEFAPGTPPNKENFPRRNRIISGLSLGVLVVEAAAESGALITARYALEQGREVFSIPGNINSKVSSGTNELIKQGAKPVVKAEDIVEELAPLLRGFIKSKEKVKISVSDEEKALCKIMTGEPKHIDDISRESGMPVSKALAVLLGLELKGIVKQLEGKRFYLA